MFFARIFRRKKMKAPVRTLRIDGTKTALTPKPDDAELAAQALLETLSIENSPLTIEHSATAKKGKRSKNNGQWSMVNGQSDVHDADYYRELSDRIKLAHEQERRAAMRYVAYCEEKLTSDISHQTSDIAELERQLYAHQDAVEREGGELKQRWQKCLALVIMKQYKTKTNTDLTD